MTRVTMKEVRVVTVNGEVSEAPTTHHVTLENKYACLSMKLGDDGSLGMDLSGEQSTAFPVSMVLSAISDLRLLSGMEDGDPHADLKERVAVIVERACTELERGDDPTRSALAGDLRTTVLELIGSAVRL